MRKAVHQQTILRPAMKRQGKGSLYYYDAYTVFSMIRQIDQMSDLSQSLSPSAFLLQRNQSSVGHVVLIADFPESVASRSLRTFVLPRLLPPPQQDNEHDPAKEEGAPPDRHKPLKWQIENTDQIQTAAETKYPDKP